MGKKAVQLATLETAVISKAAVGAWRTSALWSAGYHGLVVSPHFTLMLNIGDE